MNLSFSAEKSNHFTNMIQLKSLTRFDLLKKKNLETY